MESSDARLNDTTIRVLFVNFWSRSRARLDSIIEHLGTNTTILNANSADTIFASPQPDVVLVGFGTGSREAATFIATYKSSGWFRHVPLIALLQSKDDSYVWLCMQWGCDEAIRKPFNAAQLRARVRIWTYRRRARDIERRAADHAFRYSQRAAAFAEIIVPLGVAMMAEPNFDVLLKMILAEARNFCSADGGTLYLVRDDDTLEFQTIVNESMGVEYKASDNTELPFDRIPLPLSDAPESGHIAAYVAATGKTVLVEDVYEDKRFNFSGTHTFDEKTGYRTKSMLTIALRNNARRIIGVLQLVNAINRDSGVVTTFDEMDAGFIESLSRLAGQALESYRERARMRRQANALVIHVDETEQARQVEAITTSDYFQRLKRKANALRDPDAAMETSKSS